MVYGLEKFKEAFAAYTDNYVIIGGTACDAVLSGSSMRPRATVDIDMIIIVEKMTAEFVDAFWNFIREGHYTNGKRKRGDKDPVYEMYRFSNPIHGYPVQIELLARHSDLLGEPSGFHIEPLPTEEEQYSLSAIMLDEDYYQLTVTHSVIIDGLRYASPVALIGLKAKAYLNLKMEKALGHHVNTKDISKHRNDVLKLAATMDADSPVSLAPAVTRTIQSYTADIRALFPSSSLRDALGVGDEQIESILDLLDDYFRTE